MFVFYFAVASAVTSPVAIAAFAATSIIGSEPMRMGFAAVRVGIVMFTIPFVFSWCPELLLIEEAVTITDEAGRKTLIEGYSGETDWGLLALLGLRLSLALYLIASALARFDQASLPPWEAALRLLLAVMVLWKTLLIMSVEVVIALLALSVHAWRPDRPT